jgi:hypothetical protein
VDLLIWLGVSTGHLLCMGKTYEAWTGWTRGVVPRQEVLLVLEWARARPQDAQWLAAVLFFPGIAHQYLQYPDRQHQEASQVAYLLVGGHGLVRGVPSAGKIARHFWVCCFPIRGLVVIGWFSDKVTLFPRGCGMSIQLRQQVAAGSSWGIVVLWMCDCNRRAWC